MTAPNHALTGAVIGLSVANPWLALPMAFLSHFVCDAIPHFDIADTAKTSALSRIRTRKFFLIQIVGGGCLCVLLVLVLAFAQPRHWLLAAIAAFVATLPDVLWFPRYLHIKRTGKDVDMEHPNVLWKVHNRIQWFAAPRFAWLEAVWCVVFGAAVLSYL